MKRETALIASIAALVLLWALREIVPLIVLSIVYAVVTWPLITWFAKLLPKGVAVATVHLGIASAAIAAAVLLGPYVYSQVQAFLPELPQALQSALAALPVQWQAYLASELQNIDITFAGVAREVVQAGTTILRSTSGVAGAIVLVPALAAYMQLDAPRYYRATAGLLPTHLVPVADRVGTAIANAIGGFFRGQIIVSAIVGIMVFVVLSLMHIPHAGIIALLTSVFDLVPYLGGIVAFAPSLLLAFVYGGMVKTAIVAILLVIVFEIEAQFISPQIIGPQTRLPASTIIIALLGGSALFGILGLYLAVPVVAAAVAAIRAIKECGPTEFPSIGPPGPTPA